MINGENGLSHNQVKAILQDSYGFVWFGTVNRLNRYDGVSMKVFDCFDRELQRGNNNISALFEDPNRTLWVGTDEGVFLYHPQSESFRFFDKTTAGDVMPISWVADIQMDMDDNIWIVMPSQALFRYNQREDKLYSYSVVDNFKPGVSTPTCISIERNGKVWVGSYSSGVYLYDKSTDSFIQYLGDAENSEATLLNKHIYSMCHAGEQLYIGVHEEDLLKLNKRKNSIEVVDYPGLSHSIIRHINLVNNEEIWVSTQSGVFIIQTNEPTYSNIQADPVNRYSLSDNYVNKTYQDKEGGIWIATYFGGLNFLPNNHNRFEIYTPQSDEKSIKSRRSRVLKEDNDGNIWIGSEDAGVSRFNPNTMEFTHIKESEGKNTLSLLATKENIYAGYFKQNIDLIDHKTGKITHLDEKRLGINESSIYALCEDRYGNIWLGNAWHIYLRKKGESKFEQMEMFGDYFFFEIIEDSEGYIWAATLGNGVFQYNQEKKSIRHYQVRDSMGLSSDAISSITEDHLGQIWLSTDRGGICVFNKQTQRFTAYSTEHGLPDDVAYKIVEDKQYNLWFGTNKGLVKFNPISNETRVFTMSDGLLTDQFNYKAGMRATNGKLYFGTVHGLISFFPENLTTNNYIPPVFITKMSIYNNELTIGE
ncbi:hybrid sensor histidine kinase/response regulator, partial [Parabacteroides sp. OttesenSCG-928-N08]|nr:hybrid sensor histidine kinase/response regulator [Parabacteroides sp. OttesenSCG-928-N08]